MRVLAVVVSGKYWIKEVCVGSFDRDSSEEGDHEPQIQSLIGVWGICQQSTLVQHKCRLISGLQWS